jgi:hypothetical protein
LNTKHTTRRSGRGEGGLILTALPVRGPNRRETAMPMSLFCCHFKGFGNLNMVAAQAGV